MPAAAGPRVLVVGPLPPPSGGMANQCEQLVRLWREHGLPVELVRTNPPYRPAWAARVPGLRAGVRLVPYLFALWAALGRAQVVHLLANSGWAWHLFCAPVLVLARWRGVPVIVNYRGGEAAAFFARAPRHVRGALGGAALRVTPSAYLERVFRRFGLDAEVIPNIVDTARFAPRPPPAAAPGAPQLLVARNLEPIYDIATALRAFARVRAAHPAARLTVAGSGPERARLLALAEQLGVAGAVVFPGRVENAAMPALYAASDIALNPSTVDNMPNSVIEAFASGVPVVSTDAGGVPDLVRDGESGLLVPIGDDAAMARAVLRLLADPALAARLAAAGRAEAARFAWPVVREQWLAAYRRVARPAGKAAARAMPADVR